MDSFFRKTEMVPNIFSLQKTFFLRVRISSDLDFVGCLTSKIMTIHRSDRCSEGLPNRYQTVLWVSRITPETHWTFQMATRPPGNASIAPDHVTGARIDEPSE